MMADAPQFLVDAVVAGCHIGAYGYGVAMQNERWYPTKQGLPYAFVIGEGFTNLADLAQWCSSNRLPESERAY
jgi:hypothetical protein